MDEWVKALLSQGGFAVLAGFFGYLSWRGAQMWTNDLKAASERERALFAESAASQRAMMDKILTLTTTWADVIARNSESINSMRGELEALRAHFHAYRNALATMQLAFQEKSPTRPAAAAQPTNPHP